MATTAERFHIVLNPAEKRRWTERAKAAGLPTSEYVRRAVETYAEEPEMTPLETELLELFLTELERTAEVVREAAVEARAAMARPLEDDELRARWEAYFKANPPKLDPAVIDFSRLERAGA